MGKVVQLAAGKELARRAERVNKQVREHADPAPTKSRPLLRGLFSGCIRVSTATGRGIALLLLGAVAELMVFLRRPTRFLLSVASIGMLASLVIQWMNDWHDLQLVIFSIAGLILFPGLAAGYDQAVRFLFGAIHRFRAVPREL